MEKIPPFRHAEREKYLLELGHDFGVCAVHEVARHRNDVRPDVVVDPPEAVDQILRIHPRSDVNV